MIRPVWVYSVNVTLSSVYMSAHFLLHSCSHLIPFRYIATHQGSVLMCLRSWMDLRRPCHISMLNIRHVKCNTRTPVKIVVAASQAWSCLMSNEVKMLSR